MRQWVTSKCHFLLLFFVLPYHKLIFEVFKGINFRIDQKENVKWYASKFVSEIGKSTELMAGTRL